MRFGVGLAAVECACKTRGHLLHKSGRSTALRGCQLLLQPLVLALQVAHLRTRPLRTLNPPHTVRQNQQRGACRSDGSSRFCAASGDSAACANCRADCVAEASLSEAMGSSNSGAPDRGRELP